MNQRHVPTERLRGQVMGLAYVYPAEVVASLLGLRVSDLRAHYADEIRAATLENDKTVAETLLRFVRGEVPGATGGDRLRAAIYLSKTRMGYRENQGPLASNDEEQSPDTSGFAIIAEAIRRSAGPRTGGADDDGAVADAGKT